MQYDLKQNTKIVYKRQNGQWRKFHTHCVHCDRLYKENHESICEVLNEIKQEKFMPIHKTEKGYYWGSKGPFPTREKAEQVQRAAYAAGYREKKDQQNKDKNK